MEGRRRKYEEILGLREELASMSERLTAEQRENDHLRGLIEAMGQEEAVVEEA